MGKKKKTVILTNVLFHGIADRGQCVGKTAEGQVVFAIGPVPGDRADVVVTKKRRDFFLARVQRYLEYSPLRTEPVCTHFGQCGGCKWQHLDYAEQIRQKEQVVHHAFSRIGRVPIGEWLPILGGERTTYYRNKMEYAFSNRRWLTQEELVGGVDRNADVLGFHPPGNFDKVIDITHCWLQEEPANKIRNTIRDIAFEQGLSFYDVHQHQGFLRTLMLRVTTQEQAMVVVAFGEADATKQDLFLKTVSERLPEITTLIYCVNTKRNDAMYDLEMHTFAGPGYVEEMLGHVRYRIGPQSFFQTNTRQARALYDTVVDFAQLTGNENVYDLYTGLGSIALYVAQAARQVVGIEEITAAIDDARTNADLNGVDNVTFYAGDVKDILTPEFADRHGRPDVLITDPPRAGMHEAVVQMLLQLEAPKIVYVSCDPATQARDINRLAEKYDVIKARPVDMFPHTHHIENVALLALRPAQTHEDEPGREI
ncbi:MAG: 23S rRNA (uracil(1939)-C(5))-methyltransferase RlmD [Lewinellaceae bacterium]|nr:23S rRNA (uracil(1939)-C(5))-methyltransferase RlmD [Lewinellaceae bacterium]